MNNRILIILITYGISSAAYGETLIEASFNCLGKSQGVVINFKTEIDKSVGGTIKVGDKEPIPLTGNYHFRKGNVLSVATKIEQSFRPKDATKRTLPTRRTVDVDDAIVLKWAGDKNWVLYSGKPMFTKDVTVSCKQDGG